MTAAGFLVLVALSLLLIYLVQPCHTIQRLVSDMVSQYRIYDLGAIFRGFLAISNIPWVYSFPVRRSLESVGAVNSGVDAWAEALSGVGPLILLIGERNTKQLLREMRGVHSILSLAFAPLGLISVLISMIRLCGGHSLRSYLGYEHEVRCIPAVEVTRVNCGSIHAEVVDGSISRSMVPDPTSQAFAATLLQGQSETAITECLQQMRACNAYQSEKEAKQCPPGTADVTWCFRITAPVRDNNAANAILCVISEALDIPRGFILHQSLTCLSATTSGVHSVRTRSMFSKSLVYSSKGNSNSTYTAGDPTEKDDCDLSLSLPSPLKVSFLCTFDGLSEFSVSPSPPKFWSILVASMSLLSMLAVQVICLKVDRGCSVNWILVFVGYIGVVSGVAASAWLIYSSQQTVSMSVRQPCTGADWTHGVMVAVKNTDSLDTSGTRLLRSGDAPLDFEATWLREPTRSRMALAWIISISLTLSFICHYLGLRSSRWWLTVSELLICLTAAFARSMIKVERSEAKFSTDQQIFLDKRCYSTGILDMDRASRIDTAQRTSDTLDLRLYSLQASNCLPLTSELVAWRAAKLCLQNAKAAERILKVTDMNVRIFPGSTQPSQRRVVAAYVGGALTQEGLAFPNSQICLAFSCPMADLAAPTPLLARGLMRQPQWSIEYAHISKQTLPDLGGTYITTFDSLITWWTVAEDRNDMGDQHKNLHGSLILINIAFFLSVLRDYADDGELIAEIDKVHGSASEEDEKFAKAIIEFFGENLIDEGLV